MNNLQDIEDKYDNLEYSFVYILDHSLYYKYTTNIYNNWNNRSRAKI